MERRHFLKLLGAGAGSAALVSNGNNVLTPTIAQAAVRSDTADAAVSEFIADPPFSFNYAGQSSAILLRQWRAVRRTISSSSGRSEAQVTWKAPTGELQVQAVVVFYPSYGATEWTVSFANPSSHTSQQLSACWPLTSSSTGHRVHNRECPAPLQGRRGPGRRLCA